MGNHTIQYKGANKITIGDVAEALGISKTTVSRAISGKGRISDATRQKVREYIEKNNYRPSVVAKGLAQSKTYNIGWIMPGDSSVTELPFFQRCMLGICEVAAAEDYDILVSMIYENDISQIERVIRNKKVDGIILGRTLVNDICLDALYKSDIPFVVIGSCANDNVIQIDNDHINACKEMTSVLVLKGIRKIGIIGGSMNHVVNCTRLEGYKRGLTDSGVAVCDDYIYMNSEDDVVIERAVDDIMRKQLDCIICMDDKICEVVLRKLHKDSIVVPNQIKVASFYNSVILSDAQPSITSLQYDPKELGSTACNILFDFIDGKEIPQKTFLSYEILLKGSTQ